MLFPFQKKRIQRFSSITGIVIGALLMITAPIIKLSNTVDLSGFITGAIVFFISLLYFLDVQ